MRFAVILEGRRILDVLDLSGSEDCKTVPPCGGCDGCVFDQAVYYGAPVVEVESRPGQRPRVWRHG